MPRTSVLLIAGVALLVALGNQGVVDAGTTTGKCKGTVGWCTPYAKSPNPYPVPELALSRGGRVTLYFEHTSGNFIWENKIGGANEGNPRIFPNTCKSDKTVQQNPYGFEYWKNDPGFIRAVRVSSVDKRGGRVLEVELDARIGLTITQLETVKCGPFIDADGNPYYFDTEGNGLPSSDSQVSFKLAPQPDQLAIFLLPDAFNFGSKARWFESHVRVFGVQIYVTVMADAFVGADVIPYVAHSLSCWPKCFQGLLQMHHMTWTKARPHQVVINIPAEECRDYNIEGTEEIILQFPNLGANLTIRQKALQVADTISDSHRIEITAHAQPPEVFLSTPKWTPKPAQDIYVPTNFDTTASRATGVLDEIIGVGNNTWSTTEDCIRGRFADDTACSGMYILGLTNPSTVIVNLFRDAVELKNGLVPAPIDDSRPEDCADCKPRQAHVKQGEFGVKSDLLPELNFKNWIHDIMPQSSTSLTTLGFFTTNFWEYEIHRRDTIHIVPVFDMLARPCETSPDDILGAANPCKKCGQCTRKEFYSEPFTQYVSKGQYALNLGDKCGAATLKWAQDKGYGEGAFQATGSCPILITVTQSRGRAIGILPAAGFAAKDIWEGGATAELVLDGESYLNETNAESTLSWIIKKINGNVAGTDAFTGQRDCIFPPGSTAFGVNPTTGQLNYSVIVFTFAPCDNYLITTKETVTFLTDADIDAFPTKSFEFLRKDQSTGLTMTIDPSPGFITYIGPEEFEEADLLAGQVKFSLQLRGDRWNNNPTACFAEIANTWGFASVATSDPNSFGSASIRATLSGTTAWSLNVSSSNRVLFFQAKGVGSGYDTLKGETITMTFNQFPGACFSNAPPGGSATFKIKPQNGDITLKFQAGYGTTPYIPTPSDYPVLSENRFRRGTFSFIFEVAKDTFEDADPVSDPLSARVYTSFKSLVQEASGFNKYKDQLTSAALISLNPPLNNQLNITVQGYLKYDIAGNETLAALIDATWMASGRTPTNPNQTVEVYASAGQVVLEGWSGANQGNELYEDDFRLGKVWFNFSILGDQWRQQREPYVDSFSSDDASPFSFGSLVDEVVPSMAFFTYQSSPDGFEFMRLGLQASEKFNINSDEAVTLRLSNRTVNSGIPPVFFMNNNESTEFVFVIKVRPGQLVMSGNVQRLTEKMFRRTTVTVFLTLIGELWGVDNTTLSNIKDNIRAVPNPLNNGVQPVQGFESKKDELLKPESFTTSASKDLLTIKFLQNQKYNIDVVETIQMVIEGYMVQSKLKPIYQPLILTVDIEGGELGTRTPTITEDMVRQGTYINLELFGDNWDSADFDPATDRPTVFLRGFGSLSPVSQEPHGFLDNELGMMAIYSNQIDQVVIRVNPTPRYDIETTETLTFTVSDAAYVETGILPDPNVVVIEVTPAIRYLIVLADEKSEILGGSVNLAKFKQSIATLLSCDLDRINLLVNETSYRPEDSMKVLRLWFTGTGGTSAARTNAELGDVLISLQQDFIFAGLGAKWAYYEDAPPPYADIHDAPPQPPPPPVIPEESTWILVAWVVGGTLFIGALVGGYFVVMFVFFGAGRSGTTRRSTREPGEDKYGVINEYERTGTNVSREPRSLQDYHHDTLRREEEEMDAILEREARRDLLAVNSPSRLAPSSKRSGKRGGVKFSGGTLGAATPVSAFGHSAGTRPMTDDSALDFDPLGGGSPRDQRGSPASPAGRGGSSSTRKQALDTMLSLS